MLTFASLEATISNICMYSGQYANVLLLFLMMIRCIFTVRTSTDRAEHWPHSDHAWRCVCACAGGVNVLVSATGFHVFDTDAPENPLSGCFWWARREGCGSHGYRR